jgi:folylpolyglutamate synthase/dihydropteroate synthase
VLEVVEMLNRKGFPITDEALAKGFSSLTIPAKFEVISINPLIIIDSTHAPVAIGIVCDALADFCETHGKQIRLCLSDKKLADAYVTALTERGYSIESIIEPEKKAKAIAKKSLAELERNTILLISGDYPFVSTVRYELLGIMGY